MFCAIDTRQFQLCELTSIRVSQIHQRTSFNEPHSMTWGLSGPRGSKDGALVLLGGTQDQAGTIIFGFRKLISIFRIVRSSASLTAILLVSHATCWSRFTKTETIEFLMVDQAYFQFLMISSTDRHKQRFIQLSSLRKAKDRSYCDSRNRCSGSVISR